ncbi:DNA sulfur modification protein DndD [Spectribacter hydrogenoxidans]|uniref:DNA sulfur modification protein DndD n=1 Tax=Spectribacter hydrogenoxidans TaxID=3075608 RepID=A0ABU3BZZ6_9GAMM|nr:DNA sulfur modification protein DndD [Salinisphaera sp. W335]MDT0634882.1 DNA sulfur modification protein DndD [Salinisphaera sp. W335]
MQLTEVVLHNVGVFLGRHAVDLSVSTPERPVILFGGLNGGGKTTFLESLQLGLYGKFAKTGRRRSKNYEAYLESLINENVSPDDGSSIEIAFRELEDHSERQYRVIRTWRRLRSRISETVDVYVDELLDPSLSQSWDQAVERFLPRKLCNLFFFDGEQIEALADPSQSSEILGTAINSLLGLELVDQLVTDLQVTKRNKLRQTTDVGHQHRLEELGQKLEALGSQRAELQERGKALVKKAAQAQNELDRANADYQKRGGHLLDQMQELDRKKADCKAAQRHLRDELRESASDALPLLLMRPQLDELACQAAKEQRVKTYREAEPLLKETEQRIVQWLEHNSVKEDLIGKLQDFLSENNREQKRRVDSEIQIDLPRTALFLLEKLRSTELDRVSERVLKIKDGLATLEDQLAEVEQQLVQVPEEAALSDVISRRERARLTHEQLSEQQENLGNELAKLEATINAQEQKYRETECNAMLSGLKDQLEMRVTETADRITETMDAFKSKVLRRHLARLEGVILESYRSLLRKQGLVSDVRIDSETLGLTVLGSDGRKIEPSRLSAGERQLLATAILWGLGKASGRALPVVVDTPLGRLDASHRSNLVENYFPNASHQVILLSTDEEIDKRYYKMISSHLGGQYEIHFDEKRGGSVIRAGYPFEEAA